MVQVFASLVKKIALKSTRNLRLYFRKLQWEQPVHVISMSVEIKMFYERITTYFLKWECQCTTCFLACIHLLC